MFNRRVLALGLGLGLMCWTFNGCRDEPKREPSTREVEEAQAKLLQLKAQTESVATPRAADATGAGRPTAGRGPTTAPGFFPGSTPPGTSSPPAPIPAPPVTPATPVVPPTSSPAEAPTPAP